MVYAMIVQWVLITAMILAALTKRKHAQIQEKWLWIGCFYTKNKRLHKVAETMASDTFMRCRSAIQRQTAAVYGREAADRMQQRVCAEMWTYTLGSLWLSVTLLLLITAAGGEKAQKLWALSLGLSMLIPFLRYSILKEKADKRLQSIQLEFPVFAHKIILLTKAGLVLSNAWRVAIDEKRIDSEPLYQELDYCRRRIEDGVAECDELEEMARVLRVKEILRMMNFITVNLKRGDREILSALYAEIHECYEMRRRVAKRAGEKASVKMMAPLAMALIAMLLTVATPAILSMSNI